MNKKALKNITVLSILLISMLICNMVFAAGIFSVNKSSIELKEGKTSTFTIDGATATGKVEISSSDTSVATVSSSSVWLEKSSSTITVTAQKAGTATITVTGLVADEKGIEDTVTRTIKVTVKSEETNNSGSNNNSGTNTSTNNGTTNNNSGGNNNSTTNNNTGTPTEQPKTKSTNAYLSTLGVRLSESDAKELGVSANAYDFSGFKKSTTTYNVTVPYEVDSLKVSYQAADSGATVKVTGNSGFDVGSNNKIIIKVTAEDGKTTKTYTIKVTKLAEEEEKPGNIIEDDEGLFLTSLSIKGIDISPEFSKDTYAYTATLSEMDATEVEVNAVANKENASIEISGNTNLVVGENTINIVVKQKDSTTQTVYQITLTKEVIVITTTGEEVNFMSSLIDNVKNYVIIAVLVVALIIVAIVILIILLRKENKRLENEETEEYNVYKNDEKEFEENRVEEEVVEPKSEEITNETETKNVGRRTRRKEKGRHSK